jgi:hypothetical protein
VEDQARKAWAAWQALSMELMSVMEIPGNHRENGTIDLVRTESKEVLDMNNVGIGASGDTTKKMLHTPLDCSSAGMCVIEYGREITLYQNVPWHRIAGAYFIGGDFSSSQCVTPFNPEGLPLIYVGTASNDFSLTPDSSPTVESLRDYVMRETFHRIPAKDGAGNMFYIPN